VSVDTQSWEEKTKVQRCGFSDMVNKKSRGVFELSSDTSASHWHFMEQQREKVCLGKTMSINVPRHFATLQRINGAISPFRSR
jgi:hypothetical protein